MQVGYIRAKAGDEDALSVQRQALRDAGCGKVVEDLVSAERCGQPELRRLIDELSPGDVVVVPQLLCLGQSLPDVVRMMGRVGTRARLSAASRRRSTPQSL